MKRRVFSLLIMLALASSFMIASRSVIRVNASDAPCLPYSTSTVQTSVAPPCTSTTTSTTTTTTTTTTSTTTTTTSAQPVPGCDLDVPSTSVVGRQLLSTHVYFQPNAESVAENVPILPSGKSWVVVGLNSTEEYYKIVIACQLVWVPVGAMGPNYDSPEFGAPLPTIIVSDSLETAS